MSLNIDVMTSHDRTCVQCVGNGLQRMHIYNILSYIVLKTHIHVLSVENALQRAVILVNT